MTPTADELAGLTEDQSLALLECLFLGVIADGAVAPDEVAAFAAVARAWPWAWGQAPDVLAAKLGQVAGALQGVTRDELHARLVGLGPRIPTLALREHAFAGMFALLCADGALDDKERTAAVALAGVLEISEARASELVAEVMAARRANR